MGNLRFLLDSVHSRIQGPRQGLTGGIFQTLSLLHNQHFNKKAQTGPFKVLNNRNPKRVKNVPKLKETARGRYHLIVRPASLDDFGRV